MSDEYAKAGVVDGEAGAAAPPPPAPPAPPEAPAPQAAVEEAGVPINATTTTEQPTTSTTEPAPKVLPADWPHRDYDGPQAFEADNPPEFVQNRRALTEGTDGQEVIDLAGLLQVLGYETALSQGGNPHAIYDDNVVAAVEEFCVDYGVSEDPKLKAAYGETVVGPWLWEAITRAAWKAQAQ